ncbi:MAG: LytTR family transcriptional regulator [Bacteroidales bacterium]|nr:LytTR family transcriptional regulator [Bacteroidales bacterium]
MLKLHDPLPKYLLGKYQMIVTVTCAALFSLVMIVCLTPFSQNAWFKVGRNQAFAYTIMFFMVSLCIVILSKRLLYSLKGTKEMTILHYIVWNVIEVLVISLLYAFFTIQGESLGIINLGDTDIARLVLGAFAFGLVCIGLPYLISAQYFAIEDKNNTIRLMNMSAAVTDVKYEPHEEKRITLFDNNGVLKFSIGSENLYFIESDDNYIQVWYRDSSGEMKQYMLRCRLKTIEDSFADSDLIRCHRKYVVNISKVKLLTSEKDAYYIDLGIDGVSPIPVTKTYEQAVLARFNSR